MTEKTLTFKKYDGTIIQDVGKYVQNWVKENPYGTITIGCDSQAHSRYVKYAITIVMHNKDKYGGGHGAHVIFATVIDRSKSMKSDLYSKLWVEAEYTIVAAQMIEDCGKKITIHLDYNSKEEAYSNVLYSSGIGFIKGMGFEAMGKPFAYAASHTADAIAKVGGV